jgi:uncharacterized membrane protein
MLNFLKNALFRGLLILIPAIFLYLALRELLQLLVQMATPLADLLFPGASFDSEMQMDVVAFLLIVGVAMLLGLLGLLKPARYMGNWLEDKTLNRLPMYRMLKSFTAAFLDLEDEETFRPALLMSDDGSREPVYVVEDRGFTHVVIMQPWTPTPFAGSLKIVSKRRIELLPVSLDEFSLSLTHFGLGMAELVDAHTKTEWSEQ